MPPDTKHHLPDRSDQSDLSDWSDKAFKVGRSAACGSLLFLALSAFAQPTPHAGYVYPAGGRQGTTFTVKLGGQFLDGATNAYVSGSGVKVTVLEHTRPLTPMQANNLREQLRALQEKRQAVNAARRRGASGSLSATNAVWTAEDEKALAEIRKKLAGFQRRPPNPAIAETVLLQVTMTPDAEPGERELRLGTAQGLSNPIVFCVGQLPEFRKTAPTEPQLVARPFRNNAETKAAPATETAITLPATVNGQILQGGVDRFRFQARKGQQLVAAVSARALIPYLADAVPGWFQATLMLYDAKGKELAYDDDYKFHPDPVLYYVIPRDGEYALEIKDAIYRGRDDFVYRIEVGELPFITSIFPLGGPAGAETELEIKGWNLPVEKLTLDNNGRGPGTQHVSVRKDNWLSNLMAVAIDTLPECLEQEPNNSPDCAQVVKLPVIINGRIDQQGDWDVFRFEGKAGEQVVAEVMARRLDSPLDSVLRLTDAAGHQLAFNDDYDDQAEGLETHHADSYLAYTLPADGPYFVHLGDAQHQGGADYAYRLRLSAPRPDFALRIVPSSLNARAGVSVPVTVYALRKDGFTNEITLGLDDAPPGFVLNGGCVPANTNKVRLTLSVPPIATGEPVKLSVEGHAFLHGQRLVRYAVPAEDMEQAFAYRHLVPAQALEVAVVGRGRPMARNGLKILGTMPVKIPSGGDAKVQISTPAGAFAGRFEFELSEAPPGIVLQKVSPSDGGAEILLHSDAARAKPGLKGNLIVNVLPGKALAAAQKGKQANQRRVAIGTLPAIPFEIVE
jgi:hypothetical protein